ncbi:MAG: right-handed parallel beta-helix repeat-containing protein, partial [Planctomycetota bacterium]
SVSTWGKVVYVDADAPGANNGSNWQDACLYLQDGLMLASAGDEIRVAQGIYRPDDFVLSLRPNKGRAETFQLINGVALRGGYAGFGRLDPNARDIQLFETILSGDLDGDDGADFLNSGENCYHVVTGSGTDANAMLDGFTITAGNADEFDTSNSGGGGMYNDNGAATLLNCTFTRNSAKFYGGGMDNRNGAAPELTNCTFTENSVAPWGEACGGGGMNNDQSSPTLTDCRFEDNSAAEGGGIWNVRSNPVLIGCTFIGNLGNYFGGGVSNGYESNARLNDCTFRRNRSRNGAGLYNLNSSAELTGCTFVDNSANWHGAAMYYYNRCSTSLKNCIIVSNHAGLYGGGIYFNERNNLTLANCTFAGNSASAGNALACTSFQRRYRSNLEAVNCIFWDGGEEVWNEDNSAIDITFSNVAGGWPAAGNIDADPCFADPGFWADKDDADILVEPDDPDAVWVDGDYHLKSQAGRWDVNEERWMTDEVTSPCIDAGDPLTPIMHEPFPNGGIINMGAYGGTAEASKSYFDKPLCETIVSGDINGDCKVDFKDFCIMALHWLEDNNK